jgi:hypothetical protein
MPRSFRGVRLVPARALASGEDQVALEGVEVEALTEQLARGRGPRRTTGGEVLLADLAVPRGPGRSPRRA